MKLTLGKIYGSVNALKILNEARLPIKVTYKLSKNIKEIENNLSTINPQINSILTKYGEEINGKTIVKNENFDVFKKEYDELMTIEEELNISELTLDELESVELSNVDLLTIDFMIRDFKN